MKRSFRIFRLLTFLRLSELIRRTIILKQGPGFKYRSYPDRLRKLKLPTLSYRRLRGDMIDTYKILNHVYDQETVKFLKLWKDEATRPPSRGNSLKLFPQFAHLNVRKHSFSSRIVKAWNSLPEKVILAPSVDSFKNRLDNHFKDHELMYDNYKWKYPATGNICTI